MQPSFIWNTVAKEKVMNDLMLDVGQANELKLAFRQAGWTNGDIKQLSEGSVLLDVLRVLHGQSRIRRTRLVVNDVLYGHSEIMEMRHIVELGADPILEQYWLAEKHVKGGQFEWDPAKITLLQSEEQQDSSVIQIGEQLYEEFKRKGAYNANLLDYLLVCPELIPGEWKDKVVFFWGTIYRARWDVLAVRRLVWHREYGWNSFFSYLDDRLRLNEHCYAAASV